MFNCKIYALWEVHGNRLKTVDDAEVMPKYNFICDQAVIFAHFVVFLMSPSTFVTKKECNKEDFKLIHWHAIIFSPLSTIYLLIILRK